MSDQKESELKVLQKLQSGLLNEVELREIHSSFAHSIRVLAQLVMHPKFPERLSLAIIPRLFAPDLMRVMRNYRTNPFIRKKAEIEFITKYPKFPLGEKISFMKVAPPSLLDQFSGEKDARVMRAIFDNPRCTESTVIRFLSRTLARNSVYQALSGSRWLKCKAVALLAAADDQAPVRIMLEVIPFLPRRKLMDMVADPTVHMSVRNRIRNFLKT